MSPLLINPNLGSTLTDWRRRVQKNVIKSGENPLFSISFADDQVIIAQDSYDSEFMLRRLNKCYEKWGMKINYNKAEYLAINTETKFQMIIQDNMLYQ